MTALFKNNLVLIIPKLVDYIVTHNNTAGVSVISSPLFKFSFII